MKNICLYGSEILPTTQTGTLNFRIAVGYTFDNFHDFSNDYALICLATYSFEKLFANRFFFNVNGVISANFAKPIFSCSKVKALKTAFDIFFIPHQNGGDYHREVPHGVLRGS